MQHGHARPLALIHVVSVFRKTRQINYAEVGASRRPPVWRRLAQVIEARPDVHAGKEVVLLDDLPGLFVS